MGLRVVPRLSKRFRDLAAGPRSEIGWSGKVPNSFTLSIEKVIDLETFGLPSGPKASSSLLSSETMKNIRFLRVLWNFVKESLYFLRFFDTFA